MIKLLNSKKIILEVAKNLLFAFFVYLSLKTLLLEISENYNNLNFIFIFSIFITTSIIYLLIINNEKIYNYSLAIFIISLLLILFINIFFINIVLISLIFAILYNFITITFILKNKFFNYFINLLIFYFFSSFILLVLFIKINFSVDEGFLLLFFLLFFIYICFIFISLLLSPYIWKVNNNIKSTDKNKIKFFIILLFLLLFILIFSFSYWGSLDIFGKPLILNDNSKNEIFQEIKSWDGSNYRFAPHKNLSKQDLIDYLAKNKEDKISKNASLFLLSEDMLQGKEFKEKLIDEAKNNKFLDAGGSIKAWQFEVSERLYFYLKIIEKYPDLFNEEEKKLILNWFKKINEYSYNITLADYSYAFLFKQKPIGFYYNQEIGFGMLALFYNIFKDKEPELAEKNKIYLEKYAVGWKNNFRNTDDGISYHQDIWIQNAYLIYKYANIGDLNNAKLSFDWIINQTPIQSGTHPNYNSHSKNSALNSMIIASHLTKDGKYKYIAENMIINDMKKNIFPDSLIGFDLWNDNIESVQSEIKSYYIKGTIGTNANTKELKPDKLVLRKIINDKELFILINLRSSGWHRYNGSGSVIFIKYGDKILLEDHINNKKHNWLPKGKAGHRDKKITSNELNIYQPESDGIERLFYYLFSFDETLKYKNYNKFINKFKVGSNDIEIELDKKNKLFINLDNNKLKIYYNTEENSIFNSTLE